MRSTTLKSEDLVVVALLVVALVVRPWTAPKTSKQLTIIDRRLISLALFLVGSSPFSTRALPVVYTAVLPAAENQFAGTICKRMKRGIAAPETVFVAEQI